MGMLQRLFNPPQTRSFFLFGARGTGKTTLLHSLYDDQSASYSSTTSTSSSTSTSTAWPLTIWPATKWPTTIWIDLLEPETFDKYLLNPSLLASELRAVMNQDKLTRVIIDEVQKLPSLLDVVHLLIEEARRKKQLLQFILTGSSARKLKQGGANLLAGRAIWFSLFPLVSEELGESFSLDNILNWGSLPEVYMSDSPTEKARYLRTYARTYLREEIWNEHLVKKLPPFRKFLEVAAQNNGQLINHSSIARDVGVDFTTVQNYYQILEDTLVAIPLEPFHESVRKRQSQRVKYFFFDLGVTRALNNLLNVPLQPHTYAYGKAFEHFLIAEIFRLQAYKERDYRLSYLLTKDNVEIDLIVERPGQKRALIEIKSTDCVKEDDVKPLQRIGKDFDNSEAFCFSLDKTPKRFGDVLALHWTEGLKALNL